jgi:glycosyltransferase involved in cell wall biosynthesis
MSDRRAVKCTIAFATINKARLLARTLHSICIQKVPFEYEVVVASHGSTDATAAVCEAYGVRLVQVPASPYRNPAPARNAAYKLARGEIVICQSDDVMHVYPDTIEKLVAAVEEGTFVIASVANAVDDPNGEPVPKQHPIALMRPNQWYSGPHNPRPFFFLGAVHRREIYAVGGDDEEFRQPAYDDDWFAACLIQGRGLKYVNRDDIRGYHQDHARENLPIGAACELYHSKMRRAAAGEIPFQSSGGPWPYNAEPALIPEIAPNGDT